MCEITETILTMDHGNEEILDQIHMPHNQWDVWNPQGVHFGGYQRGNSCSRDDYVKHFNSKMKLEVANFYGKLTSNSIIDWITSMDDYIEWYNMSKEL